jgi:hypothetical protein
MPSFHILLKYLCSYRFGRGDHHNECQGNGAAPVTLPLNGDRCLSALIRCAGKPHIQLSQTVPRAALTAVARFWNQAALPYHRDERDLPDYPWVAGPCHGIAVTSDDMANSVTHAKTFVALDASRFANSLHFEIQRKRDDAQ